MATRVHTGWRWIEPGKCLVCGSDDEWECDGRGNVLCECQRCSECGELDAYGMHAAGCILLRDEDESND